MFHINKQQQFMEIGSQTCGLYNPEQAILYERLVHEEFQELNESIKTKNPVEFVDALLDIAVVTCGLILSNAESTYKLKIFELKNSYELHNWSHENNDIETVVRKLSLSCHSPMLTINNQDKFIILDSICQISYMIGLDLDLGMKSVHDNNLTKVLSTSGDIIAEFNEFGKIIKPKSYVKFDASFLVNDEVRNKILSFIDEIE